ncbi:MAG: ABC transporter permease subunit [Chloroflexi bacterium]|nr:ABC transporter permease subunit [Chloroflexota bacterium]
MNRFRTPFRILAILVVAALAWGLRARAVTRLPIDFDEDDYLRAGQEFSHLIRTSDWRGFLETNYRPEHPPLAKIIFGVSILSAPEKPLTPDASTTASPNQYLPRDLVKPARTVNAWFGILTVALLSLVNPLGGLFLAVHTFTIKYVSQIMLEALPALTSLITVLAYLQSKKQKSKTGWLAVSSIFLGLTAASKYLYCVIAIAILVDWFLDAKRSNDLSRYYRHILVWGILALVIFFAADPYLWADPIGRLKESVFYHAGYSSGATEVQSAGFPTWQPFVWLSFAAYWWHDGVFPFPFDPFITILAIVGLKRLWSKERLYMLWLGIDLLFLLFWPTKWPQYIITLTVPLSLAAAEGLKLTWDNLLAWRKNRKNVVHIPYKKSETVRALPWLIPGLIAFAVLTLFPLLFQLGVSFTDFSVASLRDGLQGGLWPAMFGASHIQSPASSLEFPFRQTQVNFIGPANYLPALGYITGPSFYSSGILIFNILWTVLSVSLQTTLGLGVALLLWQRGVRLGKFWQLLFILPWAIPEMIGAAMWFNVFQWDWGWLDLAIQKYGPNIPFAFLSAWWDSASGLWIVIYLIVALWYGFPFMMLAASAGLKLIPQDVYDAAAIDGADRWQMFRHVTWPLLTPLLMPAIIIRGIFAFNQFYLFQAFYDLEATLATTSYNVFNTGGLGHPLGGQFSLSAAINILAVILLIGFVIIFNRWSKAGEGVTYA